MKNPQSIIKHQLNNSSSKATYMFPKEKRFNERTRFLTDKYYDVPSTKSKRTTSFGYGNKTQLQNKSQSPPPGTYEPPTDFKLPKNTFSFGKGREQVQFGSFLQSSKTKKDIPAPNRYSVVLPYSSLSGKIFGKLPTQLDLVSKRQCPGPGTYNPKGYLLSDSGSYVLSTIKNQISPRLHTLNTYSVDKLKTKRSITEVSPTTYETLEKQRGKYFNSRHKNILVRSFSKSQRPGLQNKALKHSPGFKYSSFSQFGTSN